MDSSDRMRICRNYKLLVDNVLFDEICDSLVTQGILEMDISEKINEEPSEKDKMRYLLRELTRGGPDAYIAFCKAIENNGIYQHVLDALASTDLESASLNQAVRASGSEDSRDDDRFRLKANHKLVVEHVRYGDVRDYLYQQGVLNNESMEEIDMMKTSTEKERMQTLLKIVHKDGYNSFSFCRALKDYPCYSHILKALDKTDLEEARREFKGELQEVDYNSDTGVCRNVCDNGHGGDFSTTSREAPNWMEVFAVISQDAACLKRWKQLRVLSGIQEADVYSTEIRYKDDGPRECVYQLLHCWLQKKGHRASIKELIDALEKINLRAAAVKIRKMC